MKPSVIIKPAVILFIVAAITVALLSIVHSITLEPIENQARNVRESAAREVLPFASDIEEIEIEEFNGVTRVFAGMNDSQLVGYAVEAFQRGYSGQIDVMVGISIESEAITGMRIIRHTETPGLGSLAARESFYGQFTDAPLVPLRVVRSASNSDEIDSLTGATITAVAITDAVNRAIEWYNEKGVGIR